MGAVTDLTAWQHEHHPDVADEIDLSLEARILLQKMLSNRDRSRGELVELLVEHDIDLPLAVSTVAQAVEQGIVDDVALAERLVELATTRKHKGTGQIRQLLRERKLPDEVIAAALEGIDDRQQLDEAIALAQKRYRTMTGLTREQARRRISGSLQRRGFQGQVITNALREVLGEGRSGGFSSLH